MEQQQEESEQFGRVVGGRNVKPTFVLSQKDYIPTPFRISDYEVVGERLKTLDFTPLELSVIPSEHSVADPMFADFGNVIPPGQERVSHTRTGQIGKAMEEKSDEPVFDIKLFEAELAQRYEAGREAGFAEGEEAAKAIIAERYAELQQRYETFQQMIDQEVKSFIARTENQAVQLALAVARKILVTTSDVKPEYIFEVIRQGVKSLGGAVPLKIRVAPQDFEFIQVIGAPTDISAHELGITYESDENIKSGCVIDTDFGEVDLQLEKMWELVRENLFGVKR